MTLFELRRIRQEPQGMPVVCTALTQVVHSNVALYPMSHRKEPNASTPLITPSRWASGSFQLAAGCVMIQGSTGKVVVVRDQATGRWFLPRGRKDVGETLEQAAFREGYEESGFRPEPLPLLLPHRQPQTPEAKKARKADPNNLTHHLTTTEPVYITTIPVPPRGDGEPPRNGYEYTCFWYAASLPPDAVREEDTGMDDEKSYVGKLLPYEEALRVLHDPENFVVWFAYNQWLQTREAIEAQERDQESTKEDPSEPTNKPNAQEMV